MKRKNSMTRGAQGEELISKKPLARIPQGRYANMAINPFHATQ
jgi:hypothetical protein